MTFFLLPLQSSFFCSTLSATVPADMKVPLWVGVLCVLIWGVLREMKMSLLWCFLRLSFVSMEQVSADPCFLLLDFSGQLIVMAAGYLPPFHGVGFQRWLHSDFFLLSILFSVILGSTWLDFSLPSIQLGNLLGWRRLLVSEETIPGFLINLRFLGRLSFPWRTAPSFLITEKMGPGFLLKFSICDGLLFPWRSSINCFQLAQPTSHP